MSSELNAINQIISLSDGVDTVVFNPGAQVSRNLDKTDGLTLTRIANKSTPKVVTFLRSADTWEVNTTFKNRFSDYQTLFNMIKEEPNADTFTLVVGDETFTVVCLRIRMIILSGTGDNRQIVATFEIVRT